MNLLKMTEAAYWYGKEKGISLTIYSFFLIFLVIKHYREVITACVGAQIFARTYARTDVLIHAHMRTRAHASKRAHPWLCIHVSAHAHTRARAYRGLSIGIRLLTAEKKEEQKQIASEVKIHGLIQKGINPTEIIHCRWWGFLFWFWLSLLFDFFLLLSSLIFEFFIW